MTAVDFLLEQIRNNKFIGASEQIEVIYAAKAMEKQQIILSHINGQSEFDSQSFSDTNKKLAEQYYNETFNK